MKGKHINSNNNSIFGTAKHLDNALPPFHSWEGFQKFYRMRCLNLQGDIFRAFLDIAPVVVLTRLFDRFSHVLSSPVERSFPYRLNSLAALYQAVFVAIYVDPYILKEGRFRLTPGRSSDLLFQLTPHLWDINKVGVASKYIEACLRLLAFKQIFARDFNAEGIADETGSIYVWVSAFVPNHLKPYHFKVLMAEKGSTEVSFENVTLERNYYVRIPHCTYPPNCGRGFQVPFASD